MIEGRSDPNGIRTHVAGMKSLVDKGQFKLGILDMFPKEDAASS